MDEKFTCPVCGFDGMDEPARLAGGGPSYEICASCGFEFGVTDDDEGYSYEAWRERWIAMGTPWWSAELEPPPVGWNPREQLDRLLRGETPSNA